jgi:hypothetical protein
LREARGKLDAEVAAAPLPPAAAVPPPQHVEATPALPLPPLTNAASALLLTQMNSLTRPPLGIPPAAGVVAPPLADPWEDEDEHEDGCGAGKLPAHLLPAVTVERVNATTAAGKDDRSSKEGAKSFRIGVVGVKEVALLALGGVIARFVRRG